MAMLSQELIEQIGFGRVGKNALISDMASYYNPSQIFLGNNVRIDDFCLLSAGMGGITIGDNVHIGPSCLLAGQGKITLSDFSGLSARVSIYSSSDDYSGSTMTNPTVPSEYTGVMHADVFFGKHVIIGSGSVILPGITLEEGVAVGALSLVTKNCMAFGIYAGHPAKRIRGRKQDLLHLEQRYLSNTLPQ